MLCHGSTLCRLSPCKRSTRTRAWLCEKAASLEDPKFGIHLGLTKRTWSSHWPSSLSRQDLENEAGDQAVPTLSPHSATANGEDTRVQEARCSVAASS